MASVRCFFDCVFSANGWELLLLAVVLGILYGIGSTLAAIVAHVISVIIERLKSD